MTTNTINQTDDLERSSQPPVLALCLGVAILGSNSLMLGPVLDPVGASLGATPVEIARAISAYGAGAALSALCLAPHVGRIGTRRALLAALLLLAVSLLGSALAGNWIMLALAQGLAGLCAGVALPAIYALASAAPGAAGAHALGRVLTGWSISLVAIVPLSAFVTQWAGWRAPFLILAIVAVFIGSAVGRGPSGEGSRHAEPSHSVSIRQAIRIGGVPTLLLICLLFMSAFYGIYAFFGDAFQHVASVSPAIAGLAVLSYGIGFGAAAFGDRALARFGVMRAFPIVLLTLAGIYLLLPLSLSSLATAYLLAAIWGFVNHFGLNILVLMLSRANDEAKPTILGLNSAVTYLGALVGSGVAGPVYDRHGFTPVALGAAAGLALAAALAARLATRLSARLAATLRKIMPHF